MNYATIKYCDIANGIGVRTSLFVSGCTHHCEGCFNEEAWDFSYGQAYTKEVEEAILHSLEPAYIAGLTLLGGEPMEPDNQRCLLHLVERVKERYPEKTIWCYTGYVYEQDLLEGQRAYCEVTERLLSCIDILVDGRFMLKKKDIMLRFRGSANQRILDLKETRKKGSPIQITKYDERTGI